MNRPGIIDRRGHPIKTANLPRLAAPAVGGVLLWLLAAWPAAAQVFNVDTNRSSITISGSILGYSFAQQGPGSLTANYSGSIQTTQTPGTMQFTGQSAIQALNSGSWEPKSDGTTGSEPANYGAQASAGFATAKAALRNIQLLLTSPAVTVVNGQFDSSSLVVGFPTNATSSLAYNVSGLFSQSGAKPLSGYATNNVTTLATLVTAGNQQTLTIPVDATFVFTLVTANDTSIELKGQLVAVSASAAAPTIGSLAVQNQTVTLQWQGAPGHSYQVQSSADLALWQTNALNVTSSTSDYAWTGPVSGPKQFFRLAQ
ncbi:MAG: hypothetical protein KGS61_14745 [Verrucomicrobia bacterium]|nr:hypothetical protein [Verrucomicrobiota bacterium]